MPIGRPFRVNFSPPHVLFLKNAVLAGGRKPKLRPFLQFWVFSIFASSQVEPFYRFICLVSSCLLSFLLLGLYLFLSNGFFIFYFRVAGQRRSMFIQTQSTPNPSSLMFYPGKAVMEVGSADFPNARSAVNSPLAKALYGIDGKKLTLSSCSWMRGRVRILDCKN